MMSEPADPQTLRAAFGAFATGVTVVTTGGASPHGMTANSFTSVSLDPPLVLICVVRDAVMHTALTTTGRFAVSVLAVDQGPVARHFADRRRQLGMAQFDPVDWVAGECTGAPLILGAAAHFECEVRRLYDGGDHTIFLGAVLAFDKPGEPDPLLFLDGKFRQVHSGRELTLGGTGR
jgi:flavin reductase (DIM6/NTAB) family NADH-FMN oxidoreductase RutF